MMQPHKPSTYHVFIKRDSLCGRSLRGNAAQVSCITAEQYEDGTYLHGLAQQSACHTHVFIAPLLASHEPTRWSIRWFHPSGEIQYCLHGTLAAAYHLCRTRTLTEVSFVHRQHARLACRVDNGASIQVPPPALLPADEEHIPLVYLNKVMTQERDGYLLIELAQEQAVIDFDPDANIIKQWTTRAIILLAASQSPTHDYTFRYFAPHYGNDEDQATGSAAVVISHYIALSLQRKTLTLWQASDQGGWMQTEHRQHTIELHGMVTGARLWLSKINRRALASDNILP